ncbi:OmpA family protein [Ancylobacter sp. 6x-1]|uniref:OmpA family protein n=1 Tax=Ancylobacter crimeensis TaxID=2579147 RepID=A0ABT0D6V4_9HYPH|nr:OmpA family protein [Ancylobacter crimeensis]MCK0195663.1 OmpA family protein [Ancylobacter crimeensis]
MCRWQAWWKGLVPLALLALVAVFFARAPLEGALADRADDLLNEIGESWARASFDGRDAQLVGEALSEEARVKVRSELSRMSGVRIVDDRTTLLPERRPFTFSVIRDGLNVRLEGYVPSRYARTRIVEAARNMAPDVKVSGDDGLVRARGVPAGDFAGVVAFGIDQLARMPAGRVTISDDSFSIEGRAPDFTTYDALEVTVRTDLPVDFKLARFAVLPPTVSPFIWSAEREDDGVLLAGYIPLGDARRALLDAVRGAVPGAAISDQLRLADGAPNADGWLKAAAYALQQLGRLPGGKVGLSDTSISIEGRAPDFAAYDALAAARRAVPEGYTLARFAVEPPTVAPFTFGVLKGMNRIRLVGYAPSEDAKRLLQDAVRAAFPGTAVSDEMRIASGGPPAEAFVAAVSFGVSQLGKLRTGEFRGYGTAFSLTGEALDSVAFGAVSAALKGEIPGGFKVSSSDVRPPLVSPYVFGLRRDADGLTVSGFYPDAAVHDHLLQEARSQFLGTPVNDVSSIAFGAPEGFGRAAEVALRELARLDNGEVRFDDLKLHMTGTALFPSAVDSIRTVLAANLPKGFSVELALDVAPPPAPMDGRSCQKALADTLAKAGPLFAPASAALAPGSHGVLDHLAAIVTGCPEATIEIAAHADAQESGGDTDNAQSAARARAVADYFAQAGISAQRLLAGGSAADAAAPGERVQFIVR